MPFALVLVAALIELVGASGRGEGLWRVRCSGRFIGEAWVRRMVGAVVMSGADSGLGPVDTGLSFSQMKAYFVRVICGHSAAVGLGSVCCSLCC